MRRSLPARLVVCGVLAAALPSAFATEAADPPGAQYRAFWVDTFNTNLSDHSDVVAVVDNAKAARANAIFAQVRRRGDSWYGKARPRSWLRPSRWPRASIPWPI